MAIELPPLPFERDALAPHLSGETIEFHHGKHHRAYVESVNAAVKGTYRDAMRLDDIVLGAEGALLDNAAQAWNHAFYWNSLRPGGGGEPSGVAAAAIRGHFGTYGEFRRRFREAALSQFGSGWTWLVRDGDRVIVTSTSNADLPMRHGQKALLTCDVWEHAYYIDYRNARGTYVDTFLDHLVNWDWVARNLD
jgi:Fe-Mn family superoxide dismutase